VLPTRRQRGGHGARLRTAVVGAKPMGQDGLRRETNGRVLRGQKGVTKGVCAGDELRVALAGFGAGIARDDGELAGGLAVEAWLLEGGGEFGKGVDGLKLGLLLGHLALWCVIGCGVNLT